MLPRFCRLVCLFWFGSGASICLASPYRSASRPNTYRLTQTKKGQERVVLRVVQRRTGRTVWKYTAPILWGFAWSPDHRMLALFVEKPTHSAEEGYYRLILWRAGQRTRYYDNLASLRALDGIRNPALSPDKQRIAFWGFWSQGQFDVGGFLYVLPIPFQRRHFVPPHSLDTPINDRRLRSNGLIKNVRGIARIAFVGRRRLRLWKEERDKTVSRTITCP